MLPNELVTLIAVKPLRSAARITFETFLHLLNNYPESLNFGSLNLVLASE